MNDSDIDDEVPPPFLVQHGPWMKRRRLFALDSPLYDEQREALENIINWFSNPATSGSTSVVVMPTGSGKTGIICCLPYMFGCAVKEEIIDMDLSKPMLVIAPGLAIAKQLENSLCFPQNSFCLPFLMKMKLLIPPNENIRFYRTFVIGNTEEISTLGLIAPNYYEVVLSNAHKWRRGSDGLPNYASLPNDLFSVVVVDEAHHLPAGQWKNIVDHFKCHAKLIFFTATPFRQDGREITDDRAISITKDYTYKLERDVAIQRRIIRDVTFDDASYAYFEGDVKLKVLQAIQHKLIMKNSAGLLPGAINHAAIVVTKDIAAAEEVYNKCCNDLKWKNVKMVHSGNQKRGADPIKDIAANNYDLLIIVGMLLEGFDHPPLTVAGILTNIGSRGKFAQFVGRIQRVIRHPELEDESITGDIITAPEYNQQVMFDKYARPKITNKWELDDEQ